MYEVMSHGLSRGKHGETSPMLDNSLPQLINAQIVSISNASLLEPLSLKRQARADQATTMFLKQDWRQCQMLRPREVDTS